MIIDTNALLSVGFSIIASFSNVVHIPHGAVPTKVADLRKCVIGDPHSPIDLYLVDRRGTEFWIRDCTIEQFCCPGCYRDLQNPDAIPRFQGAPTLTSNEVFELATRTVLGLAKAGGGTMGLAPFVRRLGDATDPLPFYWITWPNSNNTPTQFGHTAFVEIDARKGLVTHVELPGKGFRDEAFARQISNRVCTGVSAPRGPSPWAIERDQPLPGPKPTTNEVVQGIGSWLWLCQNLGINPGAETNLASVNWSRTGKYDDPEIWKGAPVYRVTFNDSTHFQCLYGVAFSHTAADAYFTGYWPYRYPEEKAAFRGPINKRWEDLAKDLEKVLVAKVGISKTLLAPYSPQLGEKALDESFKRAMVDWRNWPRDSHRLVLIQETKLAFSAEFDLETGELKAIYFHDPAFIGAVRQAQLAGPQLGLKHSESKSVGGQNVDGAFGAPPWLEAPAVRQLSCYR